MAGLWWCSQCHPLAVHCSRRFVAIHVITVLSVVTCVTMQTFPLSVDVGVWTHGYINSSFQSIQALIHGLHFDLRKMDSFDTGVNCSLDSPHSLLSPSLCIDFCHFLY